MTFNQINWTDWKCEARIEKKSHKNQNYISFLLLFIRFDWYFFLHAFSTLGFDWWMIFSIRTRYIEHEQKKNNSVCIYEYIKTLVGFDFGWFGFSTIEFPCDWAFVVVILVIPGWRMNVADESFKWWWFWIVPVFPISFSRSFYINNISTCLQFVVASHLMLICCCYFTFFHSLTLHDFNKIDNHSSCLPYAYTS